MVLKFCEGVGLVPASKDIDFVFLMFYSLSFYSPFVVLVQMWQKRRDRKVGAVVDQTSYAVQNQGTHISREDYEQNSVFYTV